MRRTTGVLKPSRERETSRASIVLIRGHELGRCFELGGRVTIGRGCENDIDLPAWSVSSRHARIEARGGFYVLADLGSCNGTLVNDAAVLEPTVLCDNDLISVGGVVLKYLDGGNVEASYHRAIHRLTVVDGLTGLHNKRYFRDYFERSVRYCRGAKEELSVLLMDLDGFKEINDRFGHPAGDRVLKEVARALADEAGHSGLARYGGEEFVLIRRGEGLGAALKLAERIRRRVAGLEISSRSGPIRVTASIGLAALEPSDSDGDDLLETADRLLRVAKTTGKNRVVS